MECVDSRIESLLIAVSELRIPPEGRTRLGLRYRNSSDVKYIVSRLQLPAGSAYIEPNVVLAALKMVLEPVVAAVVYRSEYLEEVAVFDAISWLDNVHPERRRLLILLSRALLNLVDQSEGLRSNALTVRSTLSIMELCGADNSTAFHAPTSSALIDSAYGSDEDFILRESPPEDTLDETVEDSFEESWDLADTLMCEDESEYYDEEWDFIEEDYQEEAATESDSEFPDCHTDLCHAVDEFSSLYYQIAFLNKA